MNHLKPEEIAKLLEGTVAEADRRRYLAHIVQCETCSALYSDTALFLEGEGKSKNTLTFPIAVKPFLWDFQQMFRKLFSMSKYPLAAAVAIIIFLLVLIPFVLSKPLPDELGDPRIAHIETTINQMEIPTFSPAADEIYAAIRRGMLSEDLSMLQTVSHGTDLKPRLEKLLNLQTKVCRGMDPQKRMELIQLGCFLEQSTLATFNHQLPEPRDVAVCKDVARKYHLPGGILKRLDKMESAARTGRYEEYRTAHKKITEIIFE